MRLERFYTLVGLFVGGAAILLITCGLFIYNTYLHKKEGTYVMFFDGSLTGLDVASPVTYRGVKIGEVNYIELTEDKTEQEIKIPVYVQFYIEKSFVGKKNPVQLLIEQDFVAQIKQPNFITGNSSIEIIKTVHSLGAKQSSSYHDYPIFPTRVIDHQPMSMNVVLKTANKTLIEISEFFRSAKFRNTFDATTEMAHNLEKLSNNLDQSIPGFINLFDRSLVQFSSASNSMQNLTDYLAQHPESLLRGKQ